MDRLDLKILRALQEDSGRTNADLAEKVGLSQAACHRRVKALEGSGIIASYQAHLNADALGYRTSVFISVELESQRKEQLRAFEDAIVTIPQVMDCTLLAGTSDYLIRVIVKDV